MECLSPIRLRLDKPSPKGDLFTDVPCGKCYPCLSRRRSAWVFRLTQELKISSSAFFITLTYDEQYVPSSVSKRDCQLFLKRLRKSLSPDKIRFFLVSEYGSRTFRPHYHFLLFNFPIDKNLDLFLSKAWRLGFTYTGSVTPASISYCAKYCLAYNNVIGGLERPFMLCSRHPAIGSNYLSAAVVKYHRDSLISYVTAPGGAKSALPRYYSDKLFTKAQKAIINARFEALRVELDVKYDSKFSSLDRLNRASCLPSMRTQQRLDFNRRVEKILSKTSIND